MTLFEHSAESQMRRDAPLAARMRPRNFDEYAGQEHLVGPGRALRKSIEERAFMAVVLVSVCAGKGGWLRSEGGGEAGHKSEQCEEACRHPLRIASLGLSCTSQILLCEEERPQPARQS